MLFRSSLRCFQKRLFKDKKAAIDAEAKKAFEGHIFLWHFLIAWKSEQHDEAFVAKQCSNLVTINQMSASASATATTKCVPNPVLAPIPTIAPANVPENLLQHQPTMDATSSHTWVADANADRRSPLSECPQGSDTGLHANCHTHAGPIAITTQDGQKRKRTTV